PYVPKLKAISLASVNLSLDTLDSARFKAMTRRDEVNRVMKSFDEIMNHDIPLKVNAVVMEGRNIEDIIPLAELTRNSPVDIRFIEEMPFNGEGTHYPKLNWTYTRILEHLRQHYPDIRKVHDPLFSTASHYTLPGHQGKIGIIAAFSRTFCGTCNRIRVTAQGTLKTCLYDDGTLDLRSLLRTTKDDGIVKVQLMKAFGSRAVDGFEAEERRHNHTPGHESMSTIGG